MAGGFTFKRSLAKRSTEIRYALAEACLIGLLSAFAAVFLKIGVGWLGGQRVQAADLMGDRIALPLIGGLLGFASGWLLENFGREAVGGGIPQVKASLSRYRVPLTLRIAVVKALGTVGVLGAGMALGRRGPTVHIGAALAGQLSRWLPTSPEHRRQMIAAGAAAGLAAGFNTPIAGVLFVIEELMRDISGLTLETAILASFIGATVSRFLLNQADLTLPADVFRGPVIAPFTAAEIPFYILLGIVAGVLGALFNRGVLFSWGLNRKSRLPLSWRISGAGILTGLVISQLPIIFRDNAGLWNFLINTDGEWELKASAFVIYFVLTLLAAGSEAPGGLFSPALILGAALGFLVGQIPVAAFNLGNSNLYALAGMGAFFTAVVRVPVTAIVIVFEMTANFSLVLPLMLACASAYLVAETVSPGSLYQHLLRKSGIDLSDEQQPQIVKPNFLTNLTAADVMKYPVESLEAEMPLDEVIQAMSRSHHRGFPVIEAGKLVGIISQSDFERFDSQLKQDSVLLKQVMTPRPITVNPQASLSHVLYLLSRYKVSRLPVLEQQKLVGMITRSDIIRIEAEELSGETALAAPKTPSYVVYQTRAPATGNGRLLLPLSDSDQVSELLAIAVAIAQEFHYEIECLHIIQIPTHLTPAEYSANTAGPRELMRQVESAGLYWQVPIHTQIRIAQDTVNGIMDVVLEEHVNSLLLGWPRDREDEESDAINRIDEVLIRKVPCEVLLVKPSKNHHHFPLSLDNPNASWLLPMGGGPNARHALKLLSSLTSLYPDVTVPKTWLIQIYTQELAVVDGTLDAIAEDMQFRLQKPFFSVSIRAAEVVSTILRFASEQRCEVMILGASREGFLQHAIAGNIPTLIARQYTGTLIVVREPFDENEQA
ncbi:MAG: chloride channel protein [Cyanobacteria bacterium P01_H01_bin.15]